MKRHWIVFLGADGSGKSTVIDSLSQVLRTHDYEVEYQHWRPFIFKKGGNSVAAVDDPHGLPPKSVIHSILKLGVLVLVWRFSFLGRLLSKNEHNTLLVFDRFYGDLLVDPVRYRYGASVGIARLLFKMMPQPNAIYLLEAPADVLWSRKQEVEQSQLKELVRKYHDYVSSHPRGVLIDATQPVDRVVADIRAELSERGILS